MESRKPALRNRDDATTEIKMLLRSTERQWHGRLGQDDPFVAVRYSTLRLAVENERGPKI
jgi:hypothetical protein